MIIDVLPRKDSTLVIAQSNPVDLCFGDVLSEVNHPFPYVYFPLQGYISQIASATDYTRLSGALVGREGMMGASLGLGIKTAPWESVVYGNGNALRMLSDRWQKMLRERPGISAVIYRYLYVLMMQHNRMTTCNGSHSVNSRLARWLLMANDRTGKGYIQLTHKQLANMLGVRRSAVSIAAAKLQRMQYIQYSRGVITISNLLQLQASACSCYLADIGDYERVFPQVLH